MFTFLTFGKLQVIKEGKKSVFIRDWFFLHIVIFSCDQGPAIRRTFQLLKLSFHVYVIGKLDVLWQETSICFERDPGLRGISFSYETELVQLATKFQRKIMWKMSFNISWNALYALPALTTVLRSAVESFLILFFFIYPLLDFLVSFLLHWFVPMLIFLV